MTISSTTVVTRTNTNGSAHTFNFGHPFGDPDDLLVYLVTTATWAVAPQTKDTHYTVSNNGDEDEVGGTITFINELAVPTAPATGKVCVVLRKPELVQDYNPDAYNRALIEATFDRVYQLLQFVEWRGNARSIRLNDAYADADLVLPDVAARASKALIFDADGDLTVGDTAATNLAAMEALEALASAAAAAAQGYASTATTQASTATTQAGLSSVAAALAQDWAVKINGIVAATDYSAKAYAIGGTGVTGALGSAKEWAIHPEDQAVDGGSGRSAFHWAQKAAQSAAVISDEGIQDLIGAMLSGNTETGIAVTYQDSDGTFDFEIQGVLATLFGLGQPANDGEFLVATGASALAWESGATARASLSVRSIAELASTSNALGASLIGIEDSGGYFTPTNVETALAYLGARVADLDASVVLRGTWDASAGTFPGGGTAQAGASYIVSVGGTVDGVVFAVGDRIIAVTDNASTTTFAANWFKADYTDLVSSVAGKTGVVTLATGDIAGVTTDRLLGRDSASTGVAEELTVGGGVEFTGSGGVQRSALTGAVAAAAGSNATALTFDIVVSLDGAGDTLLTGVKYAADVHFDFACTLVSWTLVGDQSGAIKIDVWKDTYANYPPTDADSITNGHEPEIAASGVKAQDTNISDWTTLSIAAGDVLRFNVDSVTAMTAAVLVLKATKTS